jgi:hypothetical protein
VSANHDTHAAATPSLHELAVLKSGSAMKIAAAVGLLGLIATGAGIASAPHETMISYLWAFAFWVGLSLGGLFLVMIFNAAGARWTIVLRRAMETMASPLPLFALLFIPILVNAKQLYSWMTPSSLSPELIKMMPAKQFWLNSNGFTIRAVIYFVMFIAVQQLLYSWSLRQDGEGSAALTRKQRSFSAGILPFMAIAFSVAAVDWLMTLEPGFSSTIFGVYYFAGSFLGAVSFLALASAIARGTSGTHATLMKKDHWHNLGKLMLAFTAFWAYIAFSQFLLIWIANLPDEIPWFISRTMGAWKPIFWMLVVGHFFIPFFTLLSRDLKMVPGKLALVALWILASGMLDTYWLIVPAFHDAPSFHWTMITAFLGIGGLAISLALFRASGRYGVPVGDPYLDDSLRYSQP